MKIAISAESTIDLTKDLLKEYNIHTVPFGITMGDEFFYDGDIPTSQIVDFVSKTKILPKTSAVNQCQFEEHFASLLKSYDIVIHLSSSSEVSCAYSNAQKASQQFNNVYVINTRSLCSGIALLALKAHKLIAEQKSLHEIIDTINQDIPKPKVTFIVDKLDYLKKGGRCSSITCFGANLLKIHPQIIMRNGFVGHGKKYRGQFDLCVKSYCEDVLKEFPNFDNSVGFVVYTTASDIAIQTAKQSLQNAGFKKIIQTTAGATITSHCGPNAIGIIFMTK